MNLGSQQRRVAVRGVRVIRGGERKREGFLQQHSLAARKRLGGCARQRRFLVERFREMLAAFRVAGLPVCRFYKSPQGFEAERDGFLQQHSFAPRELLGGWKYVSQYISHPVSMNVLEFDCRGPYCECLT